MFTARLRPCIRPELDDEPLHRVILATRPRQQMHGLGTERARAVWDPAADLLRATGPDWDRRVHRVSVLAHELPRAAIDAWTTRHADDPDALAVRAYACVTRANARGGEQALHRAETACLDAAEAYFEDPTPWIALLTLLRRYRIAADAPEVWKQIVTRDPLNRAAHHELLRYLSPRACGETPFAMRDFAQECAQGAPDGSPLSALPLAARAEHYAYRLELGKHRVAPELSGHWYGPTVTREIDDALERWFHSGAPPHAQAVADLNILAFALVMTQQTKRAEAVFRRLGRHMTQFPWNTAPDPLTTFEYWQRRALRA